MTTYLSRAQTLVDEALDLALTQERQETTTRLQIKLQDARYELEQHRRVLESLVGSREETP